MSGRSSTVAASEVERNGWRPDQVRVGRGAPLVLAIPAVLAAACLVALGFALLELGEALSRWLRWRRFPTL